MQQPNLIMLVPGMEGEELVYLQSVTSHLNPDQLQMFASLYNGKRKNSDTILIGCLIGFVALGGIQRFLLNQIGMGLLYLFTAGLCLIGTIVDTINYKKLTFQYNQKMAQESLALIGVYR
jgi:TM2 domain-containing membrane protein YozV